LGMYIQNSYIRYKYYKKNLKFYANLTQKYTIVLPLLSLSLYIYIQAIDTD